MMNRVRRSSEAGYTIIEMAIGMLILGIVVSAFMTALFSVQRSFDRQSDRSQSNDQARLAVEEIDREVRSGNLLYDPNLENDPANGIYPGMALRIYTQTNAVTRDPGNRCVQWRILNGELQSRSWTITWRTDGQVTAWRVIADHVVNQTDAPQVAAFALDPESTKGSRTLIVTVLVNERAASGGDVRIQASVTGRNTEYGYPSDICNDIPPY
jgi:type II secretory pathway pseudopilin PulG